MPRQYNTSVMILLFLFSNFLGLMAAARNIAVTPVSAVQTSAASGLTLFTALIFVSVFILLLYKFEWFSVVKGWFVLAVFLSMLLFYDAFAPLWIAATAALASTLLYRRSQDMILRNSVLAVAFAGAGAYLGLFLGFVPVLVVLVLVAVYDAVAVFYTEHMVDLAESGVASGTFMGFSLTKNKGTEKEIVDKAGAQEWTESVNVLGGGDVVIPLLFAVAVMRRFGPTAAFFSVIGAALALYLLFRFMTGEQAYPAIPVVASGSFAGFFTWVLILVL